MSKKEKDIINSYKIARMATVDQSGKPLVVPICFIFYGGLIYTPIDSKPKDVPAENLKRVRNILENPNVSFVADHYNEDWSKLNYIIIHGTAELINEGDEYRDSLRALSGKYIQYKRMDLENLGLPVVKIKPEKIISWGNL